MIALTKEMREKKINWLKNRISSMENFRDMSPFGLNEVNSIELSAYKDSLTSLTAEPVVEIKHSHDYFSHLVMLARERAEKAISKFPQPNYVLNKVAEEHGEVIKAVIHFTEGRETWENVEGELIDNLAMLFRLVTEGDEVIGFKVPEHVKHLNGLGE